MRTVFISYSRKDMDIASQLAQDLQAAGVDAWWDISGLKGGDAWVRTIQAALKASKCCVVVLSPDGVESEWVEKEYTYAISLGLRIIPILCKNCEVPMALSNIQYIDFRGKRYERGLQELFETLGVLAPDEQEARPVPGVIRLPGEEKPTVRGRFWGVFIALVTLLVGTLVIAGVILEERETFLAVFQGSEPTVTKAPPPEITGFTFVPSGPYLPGDKIAIQVSISRSNHKIDGYRWVVRAGEGSIVGGQGTPWVTYQAPKTAGTYEVSLEIQYEGGPPVKEITEVEVVPEPTSTSTGTPTPMPTSTPTPTNTPTATPTGTPTMTPTPTLLPPPILAAPENGASIGGAVILRWQWDRPLARDEYFSLWVFKEGETEPCHHGQVQGLEYFGYLACSEGKHYWGVALARKVCEDCLEHVKWETLSEPSVKRWFHYAP